MNNFLLEYSIVNNMFYLELLTKYLFRRWLLGFKGFQEEEKISKENSN